MNKTYIDFIQDDKFIEWVLFDDTGAEAYWDEFKINHPALVPHVNEAEVFLKNYKLNNEKIDNELREILRNRIVQSVGKKAAKRKQLRLWSIIATSAAALIGVIMVLFTTKESLDPEVIVGNTMNEQDIIIIMDNKQQSFATNLQIEIDKKGNTVVNADDGTSSIYQENASLALNKLIVPYGKQSSLKLSDGTILWLNSGSEIEFPSLFPDNKREIRLLTGEMYIEVTSDKTRPFFVNTSNFDIKVYGTKFNLSTYKNHSQSVVLAQGQISVITHDNRETPVYPNQKALYQENGDVVKEEVSAEQFTSWKDGYINFNETPITQILEYVERYYNLSFEYGESQNFRTITCTGKLFLSQNIDDVMSSLATLSFTTYENRDGIIYFTN